MAVGALVAPGIGAAPVAAYVAAFAAVSCSVLVVVTLAPSMTSLRWLAVAAAAAAVAVGAAAASALTPVGAAAAVTIALLAAGSAVGGVIGARLQDAGHLIVVAVISLCVDAFSVLHSAGPSAQVAQSEQLLSVLALPWPMLGTPDVVPVLGVGDVVFAALYVAAARRHGLPVGRTVFAIAAGLAAAMGLVIATGVAIPVLPFMGVAVVAVHPRARRIPVRDRRTALIGMVTIALAVAVAFFLSGR